MKVGDLVRPVDAGEKLMQYATDESWRGIIIGFKGEDVIVFWNEDYPNEWEYPEQLMVINEDR